MNTRLTRYLVRCTASFFVFVLVAALALPAAPALAASPITVSVPTNILVAPGAQVPVSVNVAGLSATTMAYGFDLVLTYDSTKLDFISVVNGAQTASWFSEFNTTVAGTIRAALASSTPLTTNGQVLLITFQAKAATTGSVPVVFTRYNVDEVQVNKTDGSVRINTAPVAVADTYTTNEGVALTVNMPGVLGNDTDAPDGQALTAALVATVAPASGSLTFNTNGSFTYTPAAFFSGTASFTYRAVDPWLVQSAAAATVTINVGAVNNPPVANAGPDRIVDEGSSITLDGSATADVDNTQAQLTFSWDYGDGGSTVDATGINPTFSAATLDGPSNRTVTLKVTDPGGLSSTDTAVITINNVAPTANAGGPYVVDEGGSTTLNGSASSDPAGPVRDPLTYAWDFADGAPTTDSTLANPSFSAAAITGPANRTVTLTVNDGDIGTNSATANITIRDVVALDMPELRSRLATAVQFYVDLTGLNSALSVIDLTITYPANALTFGSAAATGLTTGWSVTPTPTPGQVILHMTGATPLSATNGRVVLLNFTSTSTEGATGALTISAASINGGAVSATLTTGSIYLLKRYAIGGNVTYWNAAKPVSNAALTLTGDDPHNTTTASGAYNIAQVYEGNQTLTPSKSDQVNGISAYDAALVLRHSVGTPPLLVGNALVVADVTGEGTVSSLDASLILQRSVGAPALVYPTTGSVWRFTPPTRSYGPLAANDSAANFTALLMGDVSGNWDPAGVTTAAWPASADGGEPLPLVLTVARTSPTTVLLTIALVNAPSGILAMNLDVALSAAAGAPKATAAQQVMVATNMLDARTLRVGMAATDTLKSGTVATIELTTPANAVVTAEVASLMINELLVRSQSNALFLPLIGR